MVNENNIIQLLEQHAPSLIVSASEDQGSCEQDEIVDYLVHILGDEESFLDIGLLQETLVPFLGDDKEAARAIVEALAPDLPPPENPTPPETTPLSLPRNDGNSLVIASEDKDLGSTTRNENHTTLKPTIDAKKSKTKITGQERRLKRQQRRREQQEQANQPESTTNSADDAFLEDDTSAWKNCQEHGQVWGGRGKGGRGEYAGAVNHVKSNIHLANVTVSLPNGTDLLANETMDIQKGHRYGLIGRNGCGKSTLLQRLAAKAIPGMPHDMRVLLVQQQVDGSNETPVQVLLRADRDRLQLLQEQERLEVLLEASSEMSDGELVSTAEKLGDIAGELDAIGADRAEDRALEILTGLQFTKRMLEGATHSLSGGWRMRLGLARALFVRSDLLLLDEVSNHIDLEGLDWLIRYLTKDEERTIILVSHDRFFLDAVCTDIMHLNHGKLKCHVGNFSEFERQQEEKATRKAQILDAAERKRSKAEAFVQKQQAAANRKSADSNKQRQAKMIKDKKMERIGNYREDGKRYKLNSMAKLGAEYSRLAEKVVVEVDDPIIRMHFPDPVWPTGVASGEDILRLSDFSFAYSKDSPWILRQNTVRLSRGSKVALVGKNGSGKTSFMRLLAKEADPKEHHARGGIWHHPNIRIGHLTQYSVEELEANAKQTVLEYAEEKLRGGRASAAITKGAHGNLRQYLGAFGLGGKHALQLIGKLSGGERMRLCFATVLAQEPHLLLLDESTNHCDYETLDSMSKALNDYEGSVLMVSHNQGFLSGFCKELWVLENGKITVNHSDTESFDSLFAGYRSASTGGNTESLSSRRHQQASMAKRAAQQRANTRQNAALL